MVRPGAGWERHRWALRRPTDLVGDSRRADRLGAAVDKLIAGRTVHAEPVHPLAFLDPSAATNRLQFGVSGQHGAQRLQCLQQVALVGLRELGQQLGQGSALLGQYQYRARHAPGVFR